MKKIIIFLLLFIFVFFSSCQGEKENEYNIIYKDKEYVIDIENKTIKNDENVYKYDINNNQVTIIYPNNSRYWTVFHDNGSYSGWSDDYREDKFISGENLIEIMTNEVMNLKTSKNIILIAVLLVLGVLNAVFPKTVWEISYGWIYKKGEASDTAVEAIRILGIILIIIGLTLIFM